MTEREHVYQPMRNALSNVDWCRLENMVGSGMADVNGCAPNGVSAWVETKLIKGNQITFQRFQPAWLMKRLLFKDRVFVFARKDDFFYLWGGADLRRLLDACQSRQDGKIHVVDYRAADATLALPSPVIWRAMDRELFGRN